MSSQVSYPKQRNELRRRLRYPKLALDEVKAARISRLLLLLTPLLSFTLVEALNYNNPWTDFTAVQILLNLAWYYLGELAFYTIFRRRTSAVKWGLGTAWAFGCASHYLIAFRGRTLFPADFLSLRTAANVAVHYDYTPDFKQVITFLIMLAVLLLVSLLPREARHARSWRRLACTAGVTAAYLALFFGTGIVEALGVQPSLWTTRGNGLLLNFTVCMKYMRTEQPEGYSPQAAQALAGGAAAGAEAEGETPVNVIVVMNLSLIHI